MGVMRRSCTPTCRSCGPCGSLRQPFFWTSNQGSKEDRQGQNDDGRSNRRRYLTSNQDTVRNDVKLTDTQSSYSSPPDTSKNLKSSKTSIRQFSRFNLSMYNSIPRIKLFRLKFLLHIIKNHDHGTLNDLTRQSPRNIDQYQQLFQKKLASLDKFLKTHCYRSSPYQLIHRISFLRSNSHKHDSTYSRSIVTVSYGLKKKSYSSWFSQTTNKYLRILKANEEHSDPIISRTTSSR